ncbi:unnamed protein product, partial [Adineta ricciae]
IYAAQNNLNTLSNNVLSPASGKCCIECGKYFSRLCSKKVTIYEFDGTINNGLIFYYYCSHTKTGKCKQSATKHYPNFISSINGKLLTRESFQNTDYFHIGGDAVFSKKLMLQFETLLITSHTNFQGFINSYNLLHEYECNDHRFAERRIFSQIWITYQVITLAFFMGYDQITLPSTMDRQDNDSFFYSIFQPLYPLFVKFWLNHAEYKPCSLYCSRALVVDAEISSINVGCDQTPLYKSMYCKEHSPKEVPRLLPNYKHPANNPILTSKAKAKSRMNKTNQHSQTVVVEHEAISCSTLKEKPKAYVDKCMRSFGVIVYTTNCNVTVAFNEIFRSETIKEILNGLISIVNISPSLPPCIVYDDACHLIRRLIDGQVKNEFNVTPAILYLNTKTYNIDRMHLINHRDKWCRKHLDPKTNPLLNNINTESCEQLFSWNNGYATAFTNMNQSRCRLMILITFHLRNCYLKKINPHSF